MLTDNEEINHPKSTNIYKTKTGKFTMGPIWDFDWAFAYEGSQRYFVNATRPLFWSPPSEGTRFFSKMTTDPKVKTLIKQKWAAFKSNKFTELLTFVDTYSAFIEGARNKDFQKWKQGSSDFRGDVVTLKTWLQNRANFMDSYIDKL